MAIVLRGPVVTMDSAVPDQGRVLDDGHVYIGDDGIIDAVTPHDEQPPAGFSNALTIETGGVIWPGLIDLHSHIAYNSLPLWEAPGPFEDHDQWTREDSYSPTVSWPCRAYLSAPEALLTYVQVKALVGGTTAIQGAAKGTRKVDRRLIRIIDDETFGTTKDRVVARALQVSAESLPAVARRVADDNAVLIYHVGEGVDPSLRQEFADLKNSGCVSPRLIGVHATALVDADFAGWQGGSIAWSPFSNLWLYHSTTDVETAHRRGLRICLGSDWSPSGTKHVLGELKVADILSHEPAGPRFTDAELCAMVTRNSGDALANAEHAFALGRLEAGAAADISVFANHHPTNRFRGLIAARERDVRLVLVGGQPRYGLPHLMEECGAGDSNLISVGGRRRRVVTKLDGSIDMRLSWKETLDTLKTVWRDPVGAIHAQQEALAAWGGAVDEPTAPLVLFPDMPEGDAALLAGAGEPPLDLKVSPPDTLVHDESFFDRCDRSGAPHLAKLRGYYQ